MLFVSLRSMRAVTALIHVSLGGTVRRNNRARITSRRGCPDAGPRDIPPCRLEPARPTRGFAGRDFEQLLADYSITLLRVSRADEQARRGEPMLKKVRQLIESVNDTLKGQLDLEGHGGRSCVGVAIRVAVPW